MIISMIIAVALIITLMVLVVNEKFTLASVGIMIVFFAIGLSLNYKGLLPTTLLLIKGNPYYIIGGIAAYALVGCLYSFAKWTMFLIDKRDKYLEFMAKWKNKKNIPPNEELNAGQFNSFKNDLSSHFNGYDEDRNKDVSKFPLEASNYKGTLIGWISYWPISLFWTLLHDPFIWMGKMIYRRTAATYQAIHNRIFKGVQISAPH